MLVFPLHHAIVLSGFFLLGIAGCANEQNSGQQPRADLNTPDSKTGEKACSNAQSLYSGDTYNPRVRDDGINLEFYAALTKNLPTDYVRLRLPVNAASRLGTFSIPSTDWEVVLCLDDKGMCENVLVGYSGTLKVNSVIDRLQFSLQKVIFVNSLDTPTCSAVLSQIHVDIII